VPLRQFTSTTTKIHASQATTKLRYQIDLSGAPLYHRSPSSAERTPQNATSNTRKQQTHDVATWSRTAIFSEGATTTDKHDARTHQQRWSDMYGTWEQIFWGRAMEPHPPQASEVTSDCCDGSSLQFKFLATTLLRPLPAQLRKHARTRTDLPSLTSTSQRQANTHHQRAECIFHNAPAQHTEVQAGAAHRQRRKKDRIFSFSIFSIRCLAADYISCAALVLLLSASAGGRIYQASPRTHHIKPPSLKKCIQRLFNIARAFFWHTPLTRDMLAIKAECERHTRRLQIHLEV